MFILVVHFNDVNDNAVLSAYCNMLGSNNSERVNKSRINTLLRKWNGVYSEITVHFTNNS